MLNQVVLNNYKTIARKMLVMIAAPATAYIIFASFYITIVDSI